MIDDNNVVRRLSKVYNCIGSQKESAFMKKQITLKTKIITVISVMMVIGLIMASIIALLGVGRKAESPLSNEQNNPPVDNPINEEITDLEEVVESLSPSSSANESEELVVQTAPNFNLTELNGYWTCGSDMFLGFVTAENGEHLIEYGLFATSFGVDGKITEVKMTDLDVWALDLLVFARPETEISGATPEHTETVYVDISTYDQDGRISLKLENMGEKDWHTYKYGGKTLAEAF